MKLPDGAVIELEGRHYLQFVMDYPISISEADNLLTDQGIAIISCDQRISGWLSVVKHVYTCLRVESLRGDK